MRINSRRTRALSLTPILAAVLMACAGRAVMKPNDAPRAEEPVRLLLDVASDTEAEVVAVIDHGQWILPYPQGEAAANQVAQSTPPYTLLPSALAQTVATFTGALQGPIRKDCSELYAALPAVPPALGFVVAGAVQPIRFVPLTPTSAGPREVAAVTEIVKAVSGVEVTPTIEAVYSVDLDGNGSPEIIVQATHPDLNTDFADYKPEYYSLILVLPDHAEAPPVYTGYVRAADPNGGFEVFALDAVADVDSDGQLELLVRGRHNEGTQALVYRFDGSVKEVFRTIGGEGTCEGENE